MNTAWFITRKIALSRQPNFSRFIIRVAVAAIALSISVMIIAGSLVSGFQKEISEKIFGFWGHVRIYDYNSTMGFQDKAVSIHQKFYPSIEKMPGVKHIQVYVNKPGIIKTKDEIESIVVRGFGKDFDTSFISKCMQSGKFFQAGDTSHPRKILISQSTANRLNLKVGNDITIYFIQQPPRVRKFQISGIYKTGLEEYDKLYALTDIADIQKLNDWSADSVSGFEIFLDDVKDIVLMGKKINESYVGQNLVAQTMKEVNPNIFDWLDLQNINEYVILILMSVVAIINMATALLILILERTNMIGLLKAQGATNGFIRRIFIYHAALIISQGIVIGNILGLGLCYLQAKYAFIRLPEESYYVSVAPVHFDPVFITAVNVGVLVICLLVMLVPSYMVSKVSPVKAIHFR
ncbi:MAG: ABC transporter permease [Bacteroidota bacterium]